VQRGRRVRPRPRTLVPATDGSLASAIAAASDGDTLLLRGGNHVLGVGLSGAPATNYGGIVTTKKLTIKNYPGESPVITWASLVRNNGLYFQGTAGTRLVQGIRFLGTESAVGQDANGSAQLESDGCNGLTVDQCIFDGADIYDDHQQLFYQRLGRNITCTDCTFNGNGSGGFGFHQYPEDVGVDPVTLVQGCTFNAFALSGGVTTDSKITVDASHFYNNHIGVQLRNGAVGSVITGNDGTGNTVASGTPLQVNAPVTLGNITNTGNTWT
jgi:hypothetical protein